MIDKENLALTLTAVNDVIGGLNRIKNLLVNYEPPAPPPIETKPDYLTRKATAKYLNISVSTLWRITKQGKLNSYSVGNKVMYKTNEVQNFITKNQKQWKA